jgi:phosphotransferase system IIB component
MKIEYLIIVVVLIIVLLALIKINKKGVNFDYNKLVELLGGRDNIIDYKINLSRFVVTLKDISLANKEGIQKMGAKGVVEIDNELKIILGKNSKEIKKYIDELK